MAQKEFSREVAMWVGCGILLRWTGVVWAEHSGSEEKKREDRRAEDLPARRNSGALGSGNPEPVGQGYS